MNLQAKIQKAKTVHIQEIYPGQLRQTGQTLIGKCPLHDDSNPSFAVYPETNSFYCFSGCGGGDVITLLQKIYNLEFKEAVERLSL